MKRISRYLPLLVLLFCSIQLASAQSLIDLNIGFGGVHASANGDGIEGDYTINNNPQYFTIPSGTTLLPQGYIPCSVGSASAAGIPACLNGGKTSALSGFMMGFGANLMLWKNFGIGMEATLQPGKPTLASIPAETVPAVYASALEAAGTTVQTAYSYQSRMTFYDFNGIYQPVNTHKATLQLIGGFGGANTKIYESAVTTGSVLGGSSSSQYAGSVNHLNLHAGVGVQIYINDHVYIRPQFDFHYVLNQQLFSKYATQGMVWLGYTIGDRQ